MGGEDKGALLGAAAMMITTQKRSTYASALENNDNDGGMVTTKVQCGLLDELVGGIIQDILWYMSKIRPRIRGRSDSDPEMKLGLGRKRLR